MTASQALFVVRPVLGKVRVVAFPKSIEQLVDVILATYVS